MNDAIINLCIDILFFLNSAELQEEPNIGVKLEKESTEENADEWTLTFSDYNDETLYDVKGIGLDNVIKLAAAGLQKKLTEHIEEVEGLLSRGKLLKVDE